MKTTFLYQYILELSIFECYFLVELHIKEGKRQRRGSGGTDEEPFADKLPLIHVEKLIVSKSSNLNFSYSGAKQKVLR